MTKVTVDTTIGHLPPRHGDPETVEVHQKVKIDTTTGHLPPRHGDPETVEVHPKVNVVSPRFTGGVIGSGNDWF